MNREQILDLYDWHAGICFRHPSKGEVPTTIVGTVHPRTNGERSVRGCAECVITLEDIRREQAARTGVDYAPGHLGERAG